MFNITNRQENANQNDSVLPPHTSQNGYHQKEIATDFPGSPVVKTWPSNTGGTGSIPAQGAKIQHASQPNHLNRGNVVTNSIKTFIDGPHKNIFKKKK